MEPITLQVLLMPSEVSGDYISVTTYDIIGQGHGLEGARESAIDVVIDYLSVYYRRSQKLPLPEQQSHNAKELADYFNSPDPDRLKRKLPEEEKYTKKQEVTSLRGYKHHKDQKKRWELSWKRGIVGALIRAELNRSDKRFDLPEGAVIVRDETREIPADDSLPKLIFEFYKIKERRLELVR